MADKEEDVDYYDPLIEYNKKFFQAFIIVGYDLQGRRIRLQSGGDRMTFDALWQAMRDLDTEWDMGRNVYITNDPEGESEDWRDADK